MQRHVGKLNEQPPLRLRHYLRSWDMLGGPVLFGLIPNTTPRLAKWLIDTRLTIVA